MQSLEILLVFSGITGVFPGNPGCLLRGGPGLTAPNRSASREYQKLVGVFILVSFL